MKVAFVSDIHTRSIETPAADLLIVAGDITMQGANSELRWFADWLKLQPQRHKVWIAGNHELGLEQNPKLAEEIAQETGSIYLNESLAVVEGLRIWGSPVTPWFHSWAFNQHRGAEIRAGWNKIPEALDVLITHGPPYGYLDLTDTDESVGCEDLLDVIANQLIKPPRYHVFGHIHHSYGQARLERKDGQVIELINASICDERYQPTHPVITAEISAVRAPSV